MPALGKISCGACILAVLSVSPARSQSIDAWCREHSHSIAATKQCIEAHSQAQPRPAAPHDSPQPISQQPAPRNSDPCDNEAQQRIAAARQDPLWWTGLGPQQATFAMIERERQQCHRNAEAAIARQAQEARVREEEAQLEQARGYQPITIETFELDGKDLAANSAKVSLTGALMGDGNISVLFADGQAAIVATRYPNAGGHHAQVPLLIDDASRAFRQQLLTCQSAPASAFFGCSVTVLGHVTICTQKNAFGVERELPCVAVEDGRCRGTWHR